MGRKDGGPAFPVSDAFVDSHEGGHGASLRDYFAAHALVGLLMNDNVQNQARSLDSCEKVTAAWAYEQADAMLETRESTS